MKKEQISYFTFPITLFIMLTLKQMFFNDSVKWNENIIILVISCVLMYLAIIFYNWARNPYSWRKK